MSTNYTRWYREGTVGVVENSTAITGSKTLWKTTGLKPGDIFSVDNITEYEIDQITDDTHLTLRTAYTGKTASNLTYRIIRNFTASSSADVAAQAAELLGDFAKYIDNDMQTLTGRSAYRVACDNGFTGTEAQWLESLKAAGEWTQASSRLTTLESNTASHEINDALKSIAHWDTWSCSDARGATGKEGSFPGYWDGENHPKWLNPIKMSIHKQIVRGKYLGTAPTAAQLAAIRNGTWEDLYLGDYWITHMDITYPVLDGADSANGDTFKNETEARTFSGDVKWVIVDIAYSDTTVYRNLYNVVVMPTGNLGTFPMNYKNDVSCGYLYSLIHQKAIPAIKTELAKKWPGVTFLNSGRSLSTSATGATDGWRTGYPTMLLPTASQIFGSMDSLNIRKNFNISWGAVAIDNPPQFSLHRLMMHWNIPGGQACWTSTIYEPGRFFVFHGERYLHSNSYNQTTSRGIVPYVAIG